MWSCFSICLLSQLTAAPIDASAARSLEAQRRFAEALTVWEAVAASGTATERQAAGARLAALRTRREPDGGFRCLTAIEGARRGSRAHIEAVPSLIQDRACTATMDLELRQWMAGRSLQQGHPDEALAWTLPAWTEDSQVPPELRRTFGLRHAEALAAVGRVDEARRVEASLELGGDGLHRRSPVDEIVRDHKITRLRAVSWTVILTHALVTGPGVLRTFRSGRPPTPWGLVPLVFFVGGTALFCGAWEAGLGQWGPPMLLGTIVIHLLTAWAAPSAWRRWMVPALSGMATLAVAFLALDHAEGMQLLPW